MGSLIKDRFTNRTDDRRLRWRLRARAQGRCIDCGEKSGKSWRCRPCADKVNAGARDRRLEKLHEAGVIKRKPGVNGDGQKIAS